MLDRRLLHLLHDCDQYLVRQQVLLDRAAALGVPSDSAAAMEAAMEQLAAAVDSTWRLVFADTAQPFREDAETPERRWETGTGTEPGA